MSNEQKLREIIRKLLNRARALDDCGAGYESWQSDELMAEIAEAEQVLATTEPEPTGMPPAPEPDIHYIYIGLGWKPATAQQYAETHRQKCAMHSTIQLQTYGEQCWKAGYKHGAWGDKPAVNQQLTTELDEREAFENEMMRRKSWTVYDFQPHPRRGEYPHPDYMAPHANTAWAGWQARAAMAQVSDINVVESFTNDTKDALMAGRAYAQEALIRFDDAYDRHPSTEPERNAILADIQLIDAAMAKGVKG